MKIYVRTLWEGGPRPLWANPDQREDLRKYLNDIGFYVLSGPGDSLDVYTIEEYEPYDIKLIKKALDKIQNSWYTLTRLKEVTK